MNLEIGRVKFDERGLVPAIIQDARTLEVLTLAYMNADSLAKTLETKQTWFWSRSRNELWHKGETSGHIQQVVDISLDCDGDTLVVAVNPAGPACHTGARSCFSESERLDRKSDDESLETVLNVLYQLIEDRQRNRPENSYTTYLFNQGIDKILKKIGEESTETIVAAKNEAHGPLVAEVSDLLYHLIVLLVARGVSLNDVKDELKSRSDRGGSE